MSSPPVTLAMRAVVVDGRDLTAAEMDAAMEAVLTGEASPVQLAALAVALRMKGETTSELAAAAAVMRRHAAPAEHGGAPVVLDTCGTGGSGLHTFNISTVAAIVCSAAGIRVAKHGNRAVTSKAGSADVLEALGVNIELSPEQVGACVRDVGIGFLYARKHHAAMRHAAPVRRELGLRTFFNLLGPLSNPGGATHQVVGVYDRARVRQMAEVLGALGVTAAWVVHGEGGLDEIAPEGLTHVAKLSGGEVKETTVSPADFGVPEHPMSALVGGDAQENAEIARSVLAGDRGARRDAVLVNAAASLVVAGLADSPKAGADLAAQTLDSGAARDKLREWIDYTGRV